MISTHLPISEEIQTDEIIIQKDSKKSIYEKVENSKRCKLIQMLQQSKISLKQAADELDINYSTAKTIVQTFRKEKRVAKKPKRMLETKKGMKKEKFINRFLSQYKVRSLMSDIINAMEGLKKNEREIQKGLSETATLGASFATPMPNLHKSLTRIDSASQMPLFALEEEGPYLGQISIGITANIEMEAEKKPIFFVLEEANIEDEYKEKVDYNNMVLLRNKQESMIRTQLVMKAEEKPIPDPTFFDFHEIGRAHV